MTEYKVMGKYNTDKRFRCYGHHTSSYHADCNAKSLAKHPAWKEVKVIVIDGNLKEEIIYKK